MNQVARVRFGKLVNVDAELDVANQEGDKLMDDVAFQEFLSNSKNRRRWEVAFIACVLALQLLGFLGLHVFCPDYLDAFFRLPIGLVLIFICVCWESIGLFLLFLPDTWWLVAIKLNFIFFSAAVPFLAFLYCHFSLPLLGSIAGLFVPVWIIVGIILLFCLSHLRWLTAIKWTTIFVVGVLPVLLYLAGTAIYPWVESILGMRHGPRFLQ